MTNSHKDDCNSQRLHTARGMKLAKEEGPDGKGVKPVGAAQGKILATHGAHCGGELKSTFEFSRTVARFGLQSLPKKCVTIGVNECISQAGLDGQG
ncbi:hypothetical protein PsorP6_017509 [Peronosclerospora sorghi]|uniref:Uncharacterized protein n=1 Tax=Peronosclerospora sorghi TaxID=230839 RepID=A0ACC0WM83_9STRA|nr:hypothetical protein PsorP6_017509 [Peronosclerospora sorghi]